YVTPRLLQIDGAAHLLYRQVSQPCGQFPLAITIDSVAEIGKRPAGAHFRPCLSARRSRPVTASQVHPVAVASTNQTRRRYLPSGIHSLIGRAPVPEPSRPTGVRRSFQQSLDLLVPSRHGSQNAVLPMG